MYWSMGFMVLQLISVSLDALEIPEIQAESVGANLNGSLIEGSIGATHRGARRRFYCHSNGPSLGQLGPQIAHTRFKEQPGVFPAPVREPCSLSFLFHGSNVVSYRPMVIQPDGEVIIGSVIQGQDQQQIVMIPYPAQSGIYSLTIFKQGKSPVQEKINVEATLKSETWAQKSLSLDFSEAKALSLDLSCVDVDYYHTYIVE